MKDLPLDVQLSLTRYGAVRRRPSDGSALRFVAPVSRLVEDEPDERIDEPGVLPPSPHVGTQFLDRGGWHACASIRPVRRHRIVSVHDIHDLSQERNVGASELVRIAALTELLLDDAELTPSQAEDVRNLVGSDGGLTPN
jgi:hypothetical protein